MKGYLLDTDHLTFLLHPKCREYSAVVTRLQEEYFHSYSCIVSLHEQFTGAHAALNRCRNSDEFIDRYEFLERLHYLYRSWDILSFDSDAADKHESLKKMKLKVGRMDLRIAAIALANDLVLVTRNLSDFERIPGLRIEDWSK